MPKKQTATITPNLAGTPTARPKQTLRAARSGETFVYESDEWRIGRIYKLSWSTLKASGLTERVAAELLDSFRRMMAELVEEISEQCARNVFDQIRSLLEHCTDEVRVDSFEHWRARLAEQTLKQSSKASYMTYCRIGLNAWADGNYPGLETGLLDHANRVKLGAGEKGRAVRELCPVRGPFTQLEEAGFIRWLHEAYADDVLSLQAYAILLILVEFGCRPVEIGALRAGDVLDARADQPYQLAVCSAKGGRDYRESFRTLELPVELYVLLKQVISEGQAEIAKAWGQAISPRILKQLPLFFGKRLLAAGSSEAFEYLIAKTPKTFDLRVGEHVRHAIRHCPVTTERLGGDLMPLSLYRFRRTIATRLAEAGASDETIATVLGQSSLTSLQVYTAQTYEDQAACDVIMVEAWEPVLQRVADRLLGAPIPGQAKIKVTVADEVGNCAQLCGGGVLTCYLCPKFRPFVDALHEKALVHAESLKQSRIDQGMSGPEVDSLDQSIAAIKATIRVCENYKVWGGHHG